jgi:hypothetical protein
MRARAIGADQHIAGCRGPVIETGSHGTLRVVLESNALLAVMNNAAEPFAENAAQRDAAYRQLAVRGLAVMVRQVDDEQTI